MPDPRAALERLVSSRRGWRVRYLSGFGVTLEGPNGIELTITRCMAETIIEAQEKQLDEEAERT